MCSAYTWKIYGSTIASTLMATYKAQAVSIGGTLARRARAGRAPGIFLDPCPTGDLLGGALRGALRTIFESTLPRECRGDVAFPPSFGPQPSGAIEETGTIFESTLCCVVHHGDPRRRF